MNFVHVRINNNIRQILFVIILILLGIIIFKELSFFVGGALGAITFYTILKQPYAYLTEKYNWNKSLSALLLIIILVAFLIVFGGATFEMIISKISGFSDFPVEDTLKSVGGKIKEKTGFEVYSSKMLDQAKSALLGQASKIINSAYSFIANMIMMIFILYFMLVNNLKMESTLIRITPFKGETLARVIKEFKAMIISNAIGIPAIMIAQGAVASIGYWIFGVKDPWFWGVITGFFSIIPIIGTTAIWGTLSIILITKGDVWPGIGLLAYCAILVGSTDNIIRILLGKFMADTHPLITILGVIMGLNLFGFWGIIFGPLLIDLSIMLFKIYRFEYLHEKGHFNTDKIKPQAAPNNPAP